MENHESFTTVLITYCAGPRASNETILRHADKYYPSAVTSARYRAISDYNDVSGVSLLAPKTTPDGRVATHAHTLLYIPGGEPEPSDFAPLRDAWLRSTEGATPAKNPFDQFVSVRSQDSDDVESPDCVGLDGERGPTSALAQEAGANMPLMRARNSLRRNEAGPIEWATADARDCPDYILKWCAALSLAQDGDPSTPGQRRWRPLGSFKDIADSARAERRDRDSAEGEGQSFKESPQTRPPPESGAPHPSDSRQERGRVDQAPTLESIPTWPPPR